ncbi:hypothetical protein [Streptomyces sp. NBRC 110465]|uniref:hypothetical protein n=1 Tax=Streptomyces sp. NBRC 110465 TaxID=1897621 RepID=UPI0009355E88|nr:hypothetical protein [Streptomyces sp. NBRC 110465]
MHQAGGRFDALVAPAAPARLYPSPGPRRDASPGQAALLHFAATVPVPVVSLPAGLLPGRCPSRTVMSTTGLASAAAVLTILAAGADETAGAAR